MYIYIHVYISIYIYMYIFVFATYIYTCTCWVYPKHIYIYIDIYIYIIFIRLVPYDMIYPVVLSLSLYIYGSVRLFKGAGFWGAGLARFLFNFALLWGWVGLFMIPRVAPMGFWRMPYWASGMGAGPGWPLGWIIGGMRCGLGGNRNPIILPLSLHWRLPHSQRASNYSEIG